MPNGGLAMAKCALGLLRTMASHLQCRPALTYCSLVLPRPGSAGLCFLCCMILQLAPLKNGPRRPHWLVALPWPREVNSHSLGLGLERSISHHSAGQALQPSFTSADLQLKPGPALSSHMRPCNPTTLCLGLLPQTQFRALTLVYRRP